MLGFMKTPQSSAHIKELKLSAEKIIQMSESKSPSIDSSEKEFLPRTGPIIETAKSDLRITDTLVAQKIKSNVLRSLLLDLTEVKGIGEKRTNQLKTYGINNVDDLAKGSIQDLAKRLNVSPKIVAKWVEDAKQLLKEKN